MTYRQWFLGAFSQDHFESVVRSFLKIAGGALIAHGTVTADKWTGITGIGITIVGLVYSYISSAEIKPTTVVTTQQIVTTGSVPVVITQGEQSPKI